MRACIVLFLIFPSFLLAQQNIGINNDGSSPDNSAMLHIKSTTKGMLVPRMTSVQKSNIASPATGLLVFDTDTESFWFRETSGWIELVSGKVKELSDDDADTKIQVENAVDEDTIRLMVNGYEIAKLDNKTMHIEAPGKSLFIGNGAGSLDDGTDNFNTGVGHKALSKNSSGNNNTALGAYSLSEVTIGLHNTAVGQDALGDVLNGSGNTAVGSQTLNNLISGNHNTAAGYKALNLNTGIDNSAFGSQALENNLTSYRNSAFGRGTLADNTGNNNSAFGYAALTHQTTAHRNVALGSAAGFDNQNGNDNVFIGYESGRNIEDGDYNVFIGSRSGYSNVNGNNNIFIGKHSGWSELGSNKLYIDNTSTASPLIYGDFATNVIKINGRLLASSGFSDLDGDTKIEVEKTTDQDTIRFTAGGHEIAILDNKTFHLGSGGNCVYIGKYAGKLDNGGNLGNTAIGYLALSNNLSGPSNTAIGRNALRYNNNAPNNTAVGQSAMVNNTSGSNNTAVGGNVMADNLTGNFNTAFGASALNNNEDGNSNCGMGLSSLSANISGSRNTALGTSSSFNRDGNDNICVGYQSGFWPSGGDRNTIIGAQAGYGASSYSNSGCVFLGYRAGYNESSDDKLYIENTDSSNPLIYGDFATDEMKVNGDLEVTTDFKVDGNSLMVDGSANNVGIRTTAPATSLHIAGGSDAGLSGNGYLLLGSTTAANVILDNNEIMARSNGAASTLFMQLDGGILSVGSSSPSDKLHVNSATGQNALRVQVAGSTKLRVYDHGGTSFGTNSSGSTPSNGIYVHGDIDYNAGLNSVSDIRFKREIAPISEALSKLKNIQGSTYYWRSQEFPSRGFTDEKQIGLLAQNVEEVFPEMVTTNKDGYKRVDYTRMVPVLVEAVKELSEENERLKSQIEEHAALIQEVKEIKRWMAQKEAEGNQKQLD